MGPDETREPKATGPSPDEPSPERFQETFRHARRLSTKQMDLAVRHGLDAQPRFADRPFDEVEHYLQESWAAMGAPAPWDQVRDVIRSSYEWQRAAGVNRSIELGEDAAPRFVHRTLGGSGTGGVLGDAPRLGGAERTAEAPDGGTGSGEDAR